MTEKNTDVRFEVMIAVLVKTRVFCDIAPCRLLNSYRRFQAVHFNVISEQSKKSRPTDPQLRTPRSFARYVSIYQSILSDIQNDFRPQECRSVANWDNAFRRPQCRGVRIT